MKISSQSLYRNIIKRAFIVTWRHRFLWIFGFFASFIGLGSIYNFALRDSLNSNAVFGNLASKITSISVSGILFAENIKEINLLNVFLVFLGMALGLAVIIFLIWLSVVSFGSLIKSSKSLDKKKKYNLLKSFKEGREHFWPLLGLNILGKILILLFLGVIGGLLSSLLINSSVLQAILYFFASLLLVSVSLLLSFLIIYASCFIVLRGKSFFDSIKHSWELFKENWIVTIETAVILFFINLLVKILIAILVVIFSIPFMVLMLLFYSASVLSVPTIVLGLWIFTSIIIMVLVGSYFSAFQIVAWTFLYDRINKGGVLSKLHRIFGK